MKKLIIAISLSVLLSGVFVAGSLAADGWEATIKVTADNATSRLSFGQQADATDLVDGPYDVPALLSGTLQAWFTNSKSDLWRDIRSTGEANEWQLMITSRTDSPITISWDPATLPDEITAELIDSARATAIDMKSASSYTLNDVAEAEAELIITINIQ